MAEDFFRIYRGLELDDVVQILEGAGVPGAAGDTSTALVGSQYMNTTDGSLWTKTAVGVGTDKWEKLATKNYVDSQLGTTVSWREPVVVRESTLTALPAGTVNTIDGETVAVGMRVLFSAISGGAGPNIYTASGSAGSWVWTEDTNLETTGDTTYVSKGTDAGVQFTFNGTAWVRSAQTTLDELQNIRDFIGKANAGGGVNAQPIYTSTTRVIQSSQLDDAISKLDLVTGGPVTTGVAIVNTNTTGANLQALDTYVGKLALETTLNNVTTITPIDGPTPVVTTAAKWIVRAVDAANSANVYAAEIFATHNGVATDMTKYAVLKLGSNINGLAFTVTLSGGNALTLNVESTTAVNVVARRVTVL
jgi:hypothetical protein